MSGEALVSPPAMELWLPIDLDLALSIFQKKVITIWYGLPLKCTEQPNDILQIVAIMRICPARPVMGSFVSIEILPYFS